MTSVAMFQLLTLYAAGLKTRVLPSMSHDSGSDNNGSYWLQAFKVVGWLQKAAFAAMAAGALIAAAAAGAGQTSTVAWVAIAVGAVSAAPAAWKLGQVRQKFLFVDYVQANN